VKGALSGMTGTVEFEAGAAGAVSVMVMRSPWSDRRGFSDLLLSGF
jgi:hypothetical protein